MFKPIKLLSILSLVFGMLVAFPTLPAHANGRVSLYPGQTGQFTVTYENKGDVSEVQSAILEIYVGNKMEVDPSSITESFGGGQAYCVTPTVVSTDASVSGNWGTKITYRPRSAEGTNCGGANTPGFANIPAAPENPTPATKQGVLRFRARLKDNVTDPVGTELRTLVNQGIYAEVRIGSTNVPSSFTIVVAQRPAVQCDPATQDLVNGQCVNKCPSGQIRNASGACVANTPNCDPATQELINNQCVNKCPSGQVRNSSGTCIVPAQPVLPRSGGLALVGIITAVSAFVAAGVYKLTRSKKFKVN